MKELSSKAQAKLLIPEDYSALRLGVIEKETEKAFLIDFVKNGKQYNCWFPKQYIIQAEGKIYASDWINKQKYKR